MPIETPKYIEGGQPEITYYHYIGERLYQMAGKIGKEYTFMQDAWLNFDADECFQALGAITALFTTAYNHLENGEVTKAEEALNRIHFPDNLLRYHPDLNDYLTPEEVAERAGGTLDRETWKISPGE
jgi:hypothetical protein